MEAFNTLKTELKRFDSQSSGKIDLITFTSLLNQYGLSKDQSFALAKRFSEDDSNKTINYSKFLNNFQSIVQKKYSETYENQKRINNLNNNLNKSENSFEKNDVQTLNKSQQRIDVLQESNINQEQIFQNDLNNVKVLTPMKSLETNKFSENIENEFSDPKENILSNSQNNEISQHENQLSSTNSLNNSFSVETQQNKTQKKLKQLRELILHHCSAKGGSLKEAFRTIDSNKQGHINLNQFQDGFSRIYNIPVHESWLEKLFLTGSQDRDSVINYDTFKEIIEPKENSNIQSNDLDNNTGDNIANSFKESQVARKNAREKNYENSDIFNQDPFEHEKYSQIKVNKLARFTSSDNPLFVDNNSTIDLRKQYELSRIRKFISEKAQVKSNSMKDLFRFMDTNGDGKLSYEEFRIGLQSIGIPPFSDRQFDELVSATDRSKNGFIEYDELCSFLNDDNDLYTSAISPLENSSRRRKFITPNLSKEHYQEFSRKKSTSRSKPILPNNIKIFEKLAKQINGENHQQTIVRKLKKIDSFESGFVPREVLKLALRESGVSLGNSQFELIFDQLDDRRDDKISYNDFWNYVTDAQNRLQEKKLSITSGLENVSLSQKQKKILSHTLSLFSHTKREYKDNMNYLNQTEHHIGYNALASALKSVGITLSNQEFSILVKKSQLPSESINKPQKLDTRIIYKLLTGNDFPSSVHDKLFSTQKVASSTNDATLTSTNVSFTTENQVGDATNNVSKFLNESSTGYTIRRIAEKLRSKRLNLHETFVSIEKSEDGLLTTNELRNEIQSLGINISNQEIDELFKNCDIKDNDKISFQKFANMFKASTQSFVLDKSSDPVNNIIKEKLKPEEIKRYIKSKGISGIMLESQFKDTIHNLFPNTPHWIVDRAVRISRIRNNGKCDLQKFVQYFNTSNHQKDAEGFSFMETHLTERDIDYNPRGKGLQRPDSILMDTFLSAENKEESIKFSKKMHFERYDSPPVSRYYGEPIPQSPNYKKKNIRSKKMSFPQKFNTSNIFSKETFSPPITKNQQVFHINNYLDSTRPQSASRILGRKRFSSPIFRSSYDNPISF